MAQKTIYNPKTGKHMLIRQKTTSSGRKGEIIGGHSPRTTKIINKTFGRAIRKLSTK